MSLDYDYIRQRYPIKQYLESKGYTFQKRGKWNFIPCIFHEENTASFGITEDPPIGYCFGCGRSVDVTDLAKYFGDSLEAPKAKPKVQLLHEKNFPHPEPLPLEVLGNLEDNLAFDKDKRVQWFRDNLKIRGISVDIIVKEHLGFSWSKDTGLTIPVFETTHGINPSQSLLDIKLRQPDGCKPKYRALFNKGAGKLPFIPLSCRKRMGKGSLWWIVEGELDALRLIHEDDCVAMTCTTGAPSLASVVAKNRHLLNDAQDAIIAVDNDAEGEKASKAILDALFGFNGNVWVIDWPSTFKEKGDVTDYLQEYSYSELSKLSRLVEV